jgi:hypothetical protein
MAERGSGMRAKHVKEWLRGMREEEDHKPSPLPKPSAHGFAYDATSRRIELEREHVRLRRRQMHGG